MGPKFWKATLISLAAYAVAILIDFLAGFQFTLCIVPVLYVSWTLFCVIRIVQLRRGAVHNANALECDRESYQFAPGGATSSTALMLVIVALSQIA